MRRARRLAVQLQQVEGDQALIRGEGLQAQLPIIVAGGSSCTRTSRSKRGSGTEPMDFARYAITRPVNIWILVLTCLLGGILAFFEIGRLEDPEFTIKQAIVNVQYPGATALEVEQQVTEPLESAIQQMSQIKEIRSRSMPGIAEIRVEMQDRYDGDALPQIWDELRNKINDAQGDLPPGIEPPQVNDDFGDVYGIFTP